MARAIPASRQMQTLTKSQVQVYPGVLMGLLTVSSAVVIAAFIFKIITGGMPGLIKMSTTMSIRYFPPCTDYDVGAADPSAVASKVNYTYQTITNGVDSGKINTNILDMCLNEQYLVERKCNSNYSSGMKMVDCLATQRKCVNGACVVANPIARLLSQTTTNSSSDGYEAVVVGNYAYILGFASKGIYIFDVSNAANPIFKGKYNISDDPACNPAGLTIQNNSIQNNYAYFYCQYEVIRAPKTYIIDISNKSNPILKKTFTVNNSNYTTNSLIANGNYLFLGVKTNNLPKTGGINVVDVSDPLNPRVVQFYNGVFPGNVALSSSGNYLYEVSFGSNNQTTGPATLYVIDFSNPSNLTVKSSLPLYDNENNPGAVILSGNYVYVDNGKVRIIDITNPISPRLVNTFSASNYFSNSPSLKYLHNNRAFFDIYYNNGSSRDVGVLNVSQVASPALVGQFNVAGGRNSGSTTVVGNNAYLTNPAWPINPNNRDFLIYDISDFMK